MRSRGWSALALALLVLSTAGVPAATSTTSAASTVAASLGVKGGRHVLPFSSYLGGARDEAVRAVTTDGQGNVYLAGWTNSPNWPVQAPLQAQYAGPAEGCLFFSTAPCGDAFVAKVDKEGRLVYATYLGGSGMDHATALAVDKSGAVYIGGVAGPGFPIVQGFQPAHGGGECPAGRRNIPCSDAFLAKIDPAGTALVFSTYLGGAGADGANALALDEAGDVYLAGFAGPGFPVNRPVRAFGGGQCGEASQQRPCSDAFVAKLGADGSQLRYSTYLGGEGDDTANGLAVDQKANAYLTGSTRGGFPVEKAVQPRPGGGECVVSALPLTKMPCRDAFVASLDADGSGLRYSSHLGGRGDDAGNAIAVDGSGSVYVTGFAGPGFQTVRAAQAAHGGGNCPVGRDPPLKRPCSDAFVVRLAPDGNAKTYSTYLGRDRTESGQAVAVDDNGNAIVAGSAGEGLPDEGLQPHGGKIDAVLAAIGPKGTLLRTSYLGGSGREAATSAALDRSGALWLAGNTDSRSDFPLARPFQDLGGGQVEGFVAKVSLRSDRLPYIQRLVPRSGRTEGGTGVVVRGSGLAGASRVTFGGRAARIESTNEEGTELKVIAPPGRSGEVPVTVTASGGSSGHTPGSAFFYGAGEWRTVRGPRRYHHTATAVPGGKVLVAGGCSEIQASGGCIETKATRSVMSFDPASGRWQPLGNMKRPRWGHSAVLVPAGPRAQCGTVCGKIVLLGGFEGRLTAEVFDPSTGRSQMLPPTVDPRVGAGHTATLLPAGPSSKCGENCGKLLLAVRSLSFSTPAELLDLGKRRWLRVGPGLQPAVGQDPTNAIRSARSPTRFHHSATLLPNGRVLLLGGVSVGSTAAEPLAPTEFFDPATGDLLPAPDALTYRYAGHTADLLQDGSLLLAGGLTDNIGTLTSSVEILRPATADGPADGSTGVWEAMPSLPQTPRSGHVSALLRDGRLLVVGGSDSIGEPRGDGLAGSGLAAAELFDSAAGRWQSAGTLQNRREAFVAFEGFTTSVSPSFTLTPLADGRALVVGGGPGEPEIYYPAGAPDAAPPDPDEPLRGVPPWVLGAAAGGALALVGVLVASRISKKRSATSA